MAEIEKSGKALHVYCDCGCHHKITKDNEDYKLTTYITKKQEVKKEDGSKEKNSDGTNKPTDGDKPSDGDKPTDRKPKDPIEFYFF